MTYFRELQNYTRFHHENGKKTIIIELKAANLFKYHSVFESLVSYRKYCLGHATIIYLMKKTLTWKNEYQALRLNNLLVFYEIWIQVLTSKM